MGKDVIIALDFDSREKTLAFLDLFQDCLLYTSPSPETRIGISVCGVGV